MSRRTSARLKNKNVKRPTVNLTNFMDVLTLLLFFLLVNSSGSNPLQSPAGLAPASTLSMKAPREGIIAIVVTPQAILIENEEIMSTVQAMASASPELGPVIDKLIEIRKKTKETSLALSDDDSEEDPSQELAILADQEHEYQLMRKILISGRKAGFSKLTFAAIQK